MMMTDHQHLVPVQHSFRKWHSCLEETSTALPLQPVLKRKVDYHITYLLAPLCLFLYHSI